MSMTEQAITIRKLTKTFRTGFGFKRFKAVHNLDLDVKTGGILGFLGPNGAGKTTTFKMMLGLIYPDKGDISFFGESVNRTESRNRIGFLPENPYFYSYLTAVEALNFYGQLFNLSNPHRTQRVDELLATVGLEHARNRQLRKFSRGMLQRIGIAQALINDPKLLILDEPMSGLDPMGRKEMRDIIIGCRNQGKTVIFSSHILSDVEMICDDVAIILDGKLQEIVGIDEILDQEINAWEVTCTNLSPEALTSLEKSRHEIIQSGDRVLIKLKNEATVRRLMAEIQDQGGRVMSFGPRRDSLEDIFVKRATAK